MGILDDNNLIPSYLEGDFQTSFNKLKELMQKTETFKDYNFEGSNISMIMELMSYIADFNSFYTNMVAKNVYIDTANIYETVHRLVAQKGYQPLGYMSSQTTCSVTVSGDSSVIQYGDQLYIPDWQSIDTGLTTEEGDSIFYTMTNQSTLNVDVSGGSYSFDVIFREGQIEDLSYRGEDIIDDSIILPFKDYDHGTYPFNVLSISVSVNDIEWTRIGDFYDDISGLIDNDEVYTFTYDKYQRYVLNFSSSRTVPISTDVIELKLIVTNGENGGIAANSININDTDLDLFIIENITKGIQIPVENIITFVNTEASIPGSSPETIQELKVNSDVSAHSQYRNITKKDYKSHLEMRTDVMKGYAWGEQETNPGNTNEYNKIYFSVMPRYGDPDYFMPGTINTVEVLWTDTPTVSGYISVPDTYNSDFTNDLLQYLEERKMMNVYEVPVLPELVYFRFDIGLRVKRTYSFIDVMNDVKNKLTYFFSSVNRSYNEVINFMDIHNFILDMSIVDVNDSYSNINGIDNFVIRELRTFTPSISGNENHIYEPNTVFDFPQYTKESYGTYIDNILRPIELGFNQFPALAIDLCTFENEI